MKTKDRHLTETVTIRIEPDRKTVWIQENGLNILILRNIEVLEVVEEVLESSHLI